MIGLGTILNAVGVLLGGIIGLLIGKGISQRFQERLMQSLGISVMFLSITGVVKEMLVLKDGDFADQGSFMLIVSLVVGALLGEWLNLDAKITRFGDWLKVKTGSAKDPLFVGGFAQTSMTICIGAMAIVGSIQDGIFGDYSTLLTKGILDAVLVMVMAASYGKGCLFSVLPLVALQGSVTLLARLIEPVMTPAALSNLSLVGSVLIFLVGVNIAFSQKIKVANFLPAVVVAVVCAFIPML